MTGILRRSVVFLLLLSFCPLYALAESLDDYYLNRFAAHYGAPGRAPMAATTPPARGSAERCLTPLYHGVRRDWASLSTGTRKTLAKYLAKPAFSDFPSSFTSAQGHFTIHYTTIAPNAPPLDDMETDGDAEKGGNGVPDWVETVAREFEFVYRRETGQPTAGDLAYNPAPTPSGAPYDIYLQDLAGTNRFGYTNSDAPAETGFNNSYTSYIVIDKDFTDAIYYPYNEIYPPYKGGIKGLQITAAHEYHHAIQYGYNYYFDIWYAEATSMWIEDEVYDSVNQIYTSVNLLEYLKNSNNMSLDTSDHIAPDQGYGRWIFNRHLAERHGLDVVKGIWERLAPINSPGGADIPMLPVIDATLQGYGSTLNNDFFLFTRKLYMRNWTTHVDEINMIPATVPVSAYSGYPVTGGAVTLPHYAFTYTAFSPSGTAPLNLVLDLTAESGIGAAAFKKPTDGSTITEYELNQSTGAITIPGFNAPGAVQEVALLLSNNSSQDNRSAQFSGGVLIKGDINDDRAVNLTDAIMALQSLSRLNPAGLRPDYASSGVDVNNDNRIGLEEVIYIFQKAAGIR